MSSRHDTLTMIQSRLPGRDRLIARAYRENRSFRDLCNDYRRCAAALDRWRQANGEGSRARSQEYAELLAELGREIREWTEAMEAG